MALQSKGEYNHRQRVMYKNVLTRSVEMCWNGLEMKDELLIKIHKRWKTVLELNIQGKVTNKLVKNILD